MESKFSFVAGTEKFDTKWRRIHAGLYTRFLCIGLLTVAAAWVEISGGLGTGLQGSLTILCVAESKKNGACRELSGSTRLLSAGFVMARPENVERCMKDAESD